MTEKKNFDVDGRAEALSAEGAPCPPIEEPYENEKVDNTLANETDADYDAEETNPKEVPSA